MQESPQNINYTSNFFAERLMLLHRFMPALAFGNLTLTVLAYFIFNNVIPHNILYPILILNLFITVIVEGYDLYVTPKAIKNGTALTNQRFIRFTNYRYIFVIGFTGLVWGSGALLFLDPINKDYLDLSQQAIPTALFLLIMVTALGLSPVFGIVPSVFLSYTIPAILPMTIVLMSHANPVYHWVGYGTVICLLTALFLAWMSYRTAIMMFKLQHENADLLKGLEIQTQVSEKANKDKSRFLAAASHDLRQPLHTAGLFIGILQAEPTSKQQKQTLQNLQKTVDVQSDLLNSLLDISKLDADNIIAKPVHIYIYKLLVDIANEFRLEINHKQLSLKVDFCDAVVLTDPALLQRILRNLISNAVCHTKTGSIHIICTQDKKQLLLSIHDTGPGIPDAEKENIFSEFYQLNNPERDRNKGLGLGLAIVKRLCSLLDHDITLQSTIGEGTCFTVHLPLGNSDNVVAEQANTSDSVMNPISGNHILVVDDEANILNAMQGLIESWSCQFTPAYSAEDAIEIIKSGCRPDIIISDYRLPKQTGLECIKTIRGLLSNDIPALLISGDTDPEILNKIRQSNLQLLHKPVKPAQLRIAITHLLTMTISK
jgi:signal transduction histidine kinase